MKEKIIAFLGQKQSQLVADRAVDAATEDVWAEAEAWARRDMPEGADEEAFIQRAAIRAQQLAGVIVEQERYVAPPAPVTAPEPVQEAPAVPATAPEPPAQTTKPKKAEKA